MIYGWRGKIGLIAPPGLPAEMEFHRMAPEGISILTTLVPLADAVPEELEKMANYIEEASSLLAEAGPDVIAFGCTTGSLLKGIGYDKEIINRIETCVSIPAITTSTAVIDSFKALGAKKIVVATPYKCNELNQLVKAFIEDNGFEVISITALKVEDVGGLKRPARPSVYPEWMYQLVREIFTDNADAIFISCTGIGVIDIIEPLEADLKRPVITSNQATMWAALKKINVAGNIEGFGSLFRL